MTIKATQLVAHRGYQACFPENCLIAIEAAITAGAVNIEVDIQLNDEGEVILFHDSDLLRMTDEVGSVHTTSLEQLAFYSCHEPQRFEQRFIGNPISLLKEIVPLIIQSPHVTFFVELKEESIERYGADVCLKQTQKILAEIVENIVLISFSQEAVLLAKQAGFLRTGLVLRDWLNRNDLVTQCHADYIFVNYQRLAADEIIDASVPVILYEIGDKAMAQCYLQQNAFAIETFFIGDLLQ